MTMFTLDWGKLFSAHFCSFWVHLSLALLCTINLFGAVPTRWIRAARLKRFFIFSHSRAREHTKNSDCSKLTMNAMRLYALIIKTIPCNLFTFVKLFSYLFIHTVVYGFLIVLLLFHRLLSLVFCLFFWFMMRRHTTSTGVQRREISFKFFCWSIDSTTLTLYWRRAGNKSSWILCESNTS